MNVPQDDQGKKCIEETLQLLGHFKQSRIEVERRDTALILTPKEANTFPISIYDQGEDVMITAERWHAHYDDPEQLAWCVIWLLTPFYRVVHELKAGVLMTIWLERYEAEGWDPFEPVYFANPEYPPDWEIKPGEAYELRYFQQNVLRSPQPYDEICPGVLLEDGVPIDSHFGVQTVPSERAIGPSLF